MQDENGGVLGLAAAHTLATYAGEDARVLAAPPNFNRAGGILDEDVGGVVKCSFPANPVVVDAALFEIRNNVKKTNEVIVRRRIEFRLHQTRTIEPGEPSIRVFKMGASSGLTEGLMSSVPLSMTLTDRASRSELLYEGGYRVDGVDALFAAPGDSGAAVFDEDGAVVGLVAGMLGEFDPRFAPPGLESPGVLCLPITRALNQFGVGIAQL